jgi:hypothetical protein
MNVGKVGTYRNNRCDIIDNNNRHSYRRGNLKHNNTAFSYLSFAVNGFCLSKPV